MALIGDLDVQNVSNDLIIGELVQRELIAASKFAGSIMDVSRFAQKGMKSIEFPKTGSFTVVKKVSETAVTAEALTYSTDSLALDQQAVVQWHIEDKASMQSIVELEQDALGRASRAHARSIDVDVLAALRTAPIGVTGNSGGALRREGIVAAITALDAREVPEEDRVFGIHPDEKADMFNITDFIDASRFGSNRIIQNGQIGEVFGVPVVVSTLVTAGSPLMFHKEAAAIGFQMAPRYQMDKDLPNLAMLHSLDQLYGVTALLNSTPAALNTQMCVELTAL